MKKLIVLIAVLLAVLFIVGCATTGKGPAASDLMSSARSSAPAGTLVGQATVQGTKDASAQRKAEQNAMLQIVRGMTYITGEMIDEQTASGRLSSSASTQFKQAVTAALSKASLGGVVKVDSGVDAKYMAWAVYSLNKAETLKEVTKAVNAAKEQVAAGNFNLNGFDAKFDAAVAREWK